MLTDQQHPITPPPELLQQWFNDWHRAKVKHVGHAEYIATQAARWGDEQRLEACCEWLREARNHGFGYDMGRILADKLRAARRPKPPSLAEEAIAELDIAVIRGDCITTSDAIPSLRAALERLQELENNG